MVIDRLVSNLYDQILAHPLPSAAVGVGVALCLSWLLTRPRLL